MKRQKNKRTLRQKHGTHQRQATRQEAIVTPLKFDTQQFLGSRADIEAVSLERRPGLVGMKAWLAREPRAFTAIEAFARKAKSQASVRPLIVKQISRQFDSCRLQDLHGFRNRSPTIDIYTYAGNMDTSPRAKTGFYIVIKRRTKPRTSIIRTFATKAYKFFDITIPGRCNLGLIFPLL